jgi:Protein of unknown function (DUF1153)
MNGSVEKSRIRVPPVSDLPSPSTKRWVASRKAAVVAAVRDGRITMEEALCRYQLTEEEFLSWKRAFESHGIPGLRATLTGNRSRRTETEKAAPRLRATPVRRDQT